MALGNKTQGFWIWTHGLVPGAGSQGKGKGSLCDLILQDIYGFDVHEYDEESSPYSQSQSQRRRLDSR